MNTFVMVILFNWCLLNVAFSMTKALNGQNSPEQNFCSPNISISCFDNFYHSGHFFYFYKGLTYRRPRWKYLWRSENNIENNVLFWLHGLKKHIQPTESAQISQKQDGYNTYVITVINVPSYPGYVGSRNIYIYR